MGKRQPTRIYCSQRAWDGVWHGLSLHFHLGADLAAGVGVLGLILALLGVYGVVSCSLPITLTVPDFPRADTLRGSAASLARQLWIDVGSITISGQPASGIRS